MEKQIEYRKMNIDMASVKQRAEKRFADICAFDSANLTHQRMEEAAKRVRWSLEQKMNIQTVIGFTKELTLYDDKLQIGDVCITSDYFCQIPPEAVKGAYLYVLTVGETEPEEENHIMTELYNDIWGTSYVDAATEWLREKALTEDLSERYVGEIVCLSENLGPGCYGMPLAEADKIFKLLNEVTLPVKLNRSGTMTPEKSCMGMVLVYNRNDIQAPQACLKCLGGAGGCRFCAVRKIKEEL